MELCTAKKKKWTTTGENRWEKATIKFETTHRSQRQSMRAAANWLVQTPRKKSVTFRAAGNYNLQCHIIIVVLMSIIEKMENEKEQVQWTKLNDITGRTNNDIHKCSAHSHANIHTEGRKRSANEWIVESHTIRVPEDFNLHAVVIDAVLRIYRPFHFKCDELRLPVSQRP